MCSDKGRDVDGSDLDIESTVRPRRENEREIQEYGKVMVISTGGLMNDSYNRPDD